MEKYKFNCGCTVDIVDNTIKEMDGLPKLHIDFENLRLDCPDTWALLGTKHTKGIFQLESNLGQTWANNIEPNSINELSALISLIRPGCLRVLIDGKNIPKHYTNRKHGIDEIKYFHQALEPILSETYGLLTYQEHAIKISQELAGFSLQDADVLRKSIGHKDAKLMAKIKTQFIDGCKTKGILTVKEAEEIFGWIKESQKYAFNKSHGVGYSLMGYWSAYVKTHFPWHFYTSWLYYAREKLNPQQEVKELISDAKYFNVTIQPPSLSHIKYGDFGRYSLYKKIIRLGINDIKRVGIANSTKLINTINEQEKIIGKPIGKWTWYEFLLYIIDNISSTTVNGMIQSGTLSYMNMSRTSLLFEYNIWRKLTKKEKEWIRLETPQIGSLVHALTRLLQIRKTPNRRKNIVQGLLDTLVEPPIDLVDTPYKIASWEADLFGIPITYNKLDNCSSEMLAKANMTCKEFSDGGGQDNIILAGEVTRISEHTIKNGQQKGQNMAFINLEDDSGYIDSVIIFADLWEECRSKIYNGATILIYGNRSQKKDSFITKNIKNM